MAFKIGDRVRRVESPSNFKGMRIGDEDIVVDYITTGPYVGLHLAKFGAGHTTDYFELVEAANPAPTPHKWAKEIIAWANGAEIEYRYERGGNITVDGYRWSEWIPFSYLIPWHIEDCYEYRIKPEKKPDSRVPLRLCLGMNGPFLPVSASDNNFVATFDGDTGKLKAVELLV